MSDWRLIEENQRAALAGLVHGISRLDATGHWGDGRSSASDGQRFAMPNRVLQRTYSTRFNDFALEFYSFVADNYAPFYSRPVECTDRDAPFVLDGVLYHESDLDLEEHYTDTHGYTEINFAAFAMIGMRFCPRIRGLHRQRIYCADPARDHGVLEPVLRRGRRAVNFRLIAEQWERIGQFYAAFPAGHTTASAALQRLNRFQASNRFYAANRELGRVLKTEFLLQYMSEPQLRAKVRRGLLKVEQLHALARAVYYGQRGRISAREVYDQMNACSCLTLILASIIYWQAREISRIAAAPDFPFDPKLIARISPIEWKNVILYGEITIDPDKLRIRGRFCTNLVRTLSRPTTPHCSPTSNCSSQTAPTPTSANPSNSSTGASNRAPSGPPPDSTPTSPSPMSNKPSSSSAPSSTKPPANAPSNSPMASPATAPTPPALNDSSHSIAATGASNPSTTPSTPPSTKTDAASAPGTALRTPPDSGASPSVSSAPIPHPSPPHCESSSETLDSSSIT